VLPANVGLDWKVLAKYKHSSLFGLFISNEEKKFYNIDTRCQYYKTIFSSTDAELKKGRERVSEAVFSGRTILAAKAFAYSRVTPYSAIPIMVGSWVRFHKAYMPVVYVHNINNIINNLTLK
jgi:hypothetical protein